MFKKLLEIATGHNLESYPNQLSKFGLNQTSDILLTDSKLTHSKTPGFNLESCPNQLSKLGYHQTLDRLLTDSWQTPDWLLTDSQQTWDRLTLNPTTDSKKFVEDDTRSQFGELSKSALQIWRAFQISSLNLVTIRLSKEFSQMPNGLLIDTQQAPESFFWQTYIKPQNSL